LKDTLWEFTEKVDGVNIRVVYDHEHGQVRMYGKDDKTQIPPFLRAWIETELTPARLAVLGRSVCLYGEGYGHRIQKVGTQYNPDGVRFMLFDMVELDELGRPGPFLSGSDMRACAQQIGIEAAPVVGYGKLHHMIQVVRTGLTSEWGAFPAEGIVARPFVPLYGHDQQRIITKVKAKDFRYEKADNNVE